MSQTPPFLLRQGAGRLIISVPHAGIYLPSQIAQNLTPMGRDIVDTDWHVDKLYGFAERLGATLLVATHSRTVVDLNRAPGGGALYPGQAETTICPTETFDGAPLYAIAPPGQEEIDARIDAYWRPYHDALEAELNRIRALHGTARLLDAHSIRTEIPRLFAGRLPDLNFGTNSGASSDPALVARALAATSDSRFSQVLDGRFRGGYITRHYGAPARNIHAIQLELAQSCYLDEENPRSWAPAHAASLILVLEKLVSALLSA